MAEEVECDGWRSRMRWLKESNAMAEGDECCGRRRLKQTTTSGTLSQHRAHCISFDSYIKPQLMKYNELFELVVYLLIPTSNHNTKSVHFILVELYIFWFLHQTTTCFGLCSYWCRLYIFWFLHQTTTLMMILTFLLCCISFDSYIKPQPSTPMNWHEICCISFDSYIKPQLTWLW